MGVRLELPHQDLPRAETALNSCLCLGRGSPLTPVRPPYLGSCLLPWLPVTGQGHTSALVSVPSTCRQPLPLTLNVRRGQPCGCPQRCCSWARVLLGRGLCPAPPAPAASVSSSLPPWQVCLPCLYILPACPCCQLGRWGAASSSLAPLAAREGGCLVLCWPLFSLLCSSWQPPLLVSPLSPHSLCPPPLPLPPTHPHST